MQDTPNLVHSAQLWLNPGAGLAFFVASLAIAPAP